MQNFSEIYDRELPEIKPKEIPDYEVKERFEIDELLMERLNFLRSQIQEIQSDLDKRLTLSEEFEEEFEREIQEFYPELHHLEDSSFFNPQEDRKSELEERFFEVKEHRRDNKLEEWRDLVDLKRELREILEEYHSLARVVLNTP